MDHVSQYPTAYYRVSLKAVIRNERGEVLVNKEYDSDTWSLPGGGWDHGESEYEALARELKEEVGYVGKFTQTIKATQVFWLESKRAWLLWIVYDVVTENQEFTTGKDSSAIGFINPETLSKDSKSRAEQWIRQHL